MLTPPPGMSPPPAPPREKKLIFPSGYFGELKRLGPSDLAIRACLFPKCHVTHQTSCTSFLVHTYLSIIPYRRRSDSSGSVTDGRCHSCAHHSGGAHHSSCHSSLHDLPAPEGGVQTSLWADEIRGSSTSADASQP